MNSFGHLNPDDFKRWMKRHEQDVESDVDSLIGMKVEARFCGKRMARNITLESGKAGRVIREFVQSGGVVKSIEGEEYLISVDSGSFYTNKRNVVI